VPWSWDKASYKRGFYTIREEHCSKWTKMTRWATGMRRWGMGRMCRHRKFISMEESPALLHLSNRHIESNMDQWRTGEALSRALGIAHVLPHHKGGLTCHVYVRPHVLVEIAHAAHGGSPSGVYHPNKTEQQLEIKDCLCGTCKQDMNWCMWLTIQHVEYS
jgi:hypothetical protein